MRTTVILAAVVQFGVLLMGTPGFCQVEHVTIPKKAGVVIPASTSLLDDVTSLEKSVYGHATTDALAVRVAHLEMDTLGRLQTGSLRVRVDWLQHVVQKTEPGDELRGSPSTSEVAPPVAPPRTVSASTTVSASKETAPLHLDPKIEEKIPVPFKPDAVQTDAAKSDSPSSGSLFSADGSPASADHPLLQGAVDESLVKASDYRSQGDLQSGTTNVTLPAVAQENHQKSHKFRHELAVGAGTTLKAAGLVAAAAVMVAGGVAASSGSGFGPFGYINASEHRDLCGCHFIQPAIHHHR